MLTEPSGQGDFHDCPACGRRVRVRDILGYDMVCDATILIVGTEHRDWGTSGPHWCPGPEGTE